MTNNMEIIEDENSKNVAYARMDEEERTRAVARTKGYVTITGDVFLNTKKGGILGRHQPSCIITCRMYAHGLATRRTSQNLCNRTGNSIHSFRSF